MIVESRLRFDTCEIERAEIRLAYCRKERDRFIGGGIDVTDPRHERTLRKLAEDLAKAESDSNWAHRRAAEAKGVGIFTNETE